MGLAWFGNDAWSDERPPTTPIDCHCTKCEAEFIWDKPLTLDAKFKVPLPCPKCGGKVEIDLPIRSQ